MNSRVFCLVSKEGPRNEDLLKECIAAFDEIAELSGPQ